MDKEYWLKTKLCAYIWFCGDDECGCHQAVIEKVSPNLTCGYPWIHRDRFWEGTFHSDNEDLTEIEEELKAAITKYREQDYEIIEGNY